MRTLKIRHLATIRRLERYYHLVFVASTASLDADLPAKLADAIDDLETAIADELAKTLESEQVSDIDTADALRLDWYVQDGFLRRASR